MEKEFGLKEIKVLAKQFSPQEIETCINQQIVSSSNTCDISGPSEPVITVLSKAEYVKRLMQQEDMSLNDAVRELAKRIRDLQDE
jgi:hypothetical protein